MKISRLLPTIQMQLAITDDDTSAQCVQCFLANMLDIGSILQLPSQRFQQEKLTIRECKDELMLAIGQFMFLREVKASTGITPFPMLMLTGTMLIYSEV